MHQNYNAITWTNRFKSVQVRHNTLIAVIILCTRLLLLLLFFVFGTQPKYFTLVFFSSNVT